MAVSDVRRYPSRGEVPPRKLPGRDPQHSSRIFEGMGASSPKLELYEGALLLLVEERCWSNENVDVFTFQPQEVA